MPVGPVARPSSASPSRSSSASQYREYRHKVRERRARKNHAESGGGYRPSGHGRFGGRERSRKARTRRVSTLLRAYWSLNEGQRPRLIGALAGLTVTVLLGLAPLAAPKPILDVVIGDRPTPAWLVAWSPALAEPRTLLAAIGIGLIVLAVLKTVVGTFSRWQATKVSKRLTVNTRRRAFDHAVRLPLQRVYDLKSGGVASILREDAGGVGELTFNLVYNPWSAVVQLLASFVTLAILDWRLLVAASVLLPIVWFSHRQWINRIRPLWRDVRSTRQGIDAHATETFGGMRVVRSFSRQRTEATRFAGDNHFMARQELFTWWQMRAIDALWSVLIPLASAGLLWYGGLRVLEGHLTVGDLVVFLALLTALLGPIEALAHSAVGLQNNLAGLDRTLDLLEETPDFEPTPDAVVIARQDVRGHVRLEDVSFAYARRSGSTEHDASPGERSDVLHEITLDVPAGQTVALVGPSGAGKTTLCNLVARFYDPTDGRITLDGMDLRDVHVDSYRRLLGIVEQDTFLFDGTIADNIAYGTRDATPAAIVRAAKLANAHGFITDLPEEYDTHIGERGVKLSGGQRQRLTIARAILADPKILILDEATSNLDTESERLIQGSLKALMRGRTSFVIAHRLSTIAGADRIVVLEAGRVVESGTHEELMNRSGRYRQMVDLQTRPAEVVDPDRFDENDQPAPAAANGWLAAGPTS